MRPRLIVSLILAACQPTSSPHDAGTDAARSPDVAMDAPDVRVPPVDGGDGEFQARPIPGRWYGGDFHVHATGASNDAGEESTPRRIKEVAVERGLDFVVLTDHSNSTGSDPTTRDEDPTLFNLGPEFPYWDVARELSDEEFLMIDGNEISPVDEPPHSPTGHIGCYPRELDTFNPHIAFRDRPRGEVEGWEVVEQARDAGCFVTINHPFVATQWMAFDWTTRDYDALEVYNGGAGWDRFDYLAVRGWACDLAQGKRVTAIGGSDNHRVQIEPPGTLTDPPLGWPVTYVWSGTLAWPGIIASLDRGRVSISDTGVPLDVDAYDADRRWLAMQGDTVDAERVRWVRVRGTLANSEGAARVLEIVRGSRDGCDDLREVDELTAPEPQLDVLATLEIPPDSAFDHAVEVSVSPGDFVFGWLHQGGPNVIDVRGAAVTNAIRAE